MLLGAQIRIPGLKDWTLPIRSDINSLRFYIILFFQDCFISSLPLPYTWFIFEPWIMLMLQVAFAYCFSLSNGMGACKQLLSTLSCTPHCVRGLHVFWYYCCCVLFFFNLFTLLCSYFCSMRFCLLPLYLSYFSRVTVSITVDYDLFFEMSAKLFYIVKY